MLGARFRRDIAPLAMPIFFGLLIFQVQVSINRAFLGQVDGSWLAVISNVVFPMWTTMSMLNALATGATITMSHALGAGNARAAKSLAAASLIGNTVLSLVLLAFWTTSSGLVYSAMGVKGKILEDCVAYTSVAAVSFAANGLNGALGAIFQASARTGPIMTSGIVKSLLNLVLDYLLIFGNFGFPHMGLIGAAVASAISDFAGLAILALILLFSKGIEARPDRAAWKSVRIADYGTVVRMGLPSSFEDLLWNIGNLIMISYLNRIDPMASAVYGIVFTIEILPIVIFISLSQSSTVLVGRAKGAGLQSQARGVVFTVQTAAWIASLVTLFIFLTIPKFLVSIFTSDPELIRRAAPILLISCITFFPRSVNFMAGSGIRGLGHTRWMLGTQILGTVFVVSLGYLTVIGIGWGVAGLFLAMCADELVRAIINGVRFHRLAGNERPAQEIRAPEAS